MLLYKALAVALFACITSQQDLDFSNLEVVSDLTPDLCFAQSSYFVLQYDDGLPRCIPFNTTADRPKDCKDYHNPNLNVQSKPSCNKDDSFAPVQCKGQRTTGRCYCFNSEGERIFGEDWWTNAANMSCACSRRKDYMSKNSPSSLYFNSLHCNSRGNYETLQCDVVSEQCWCAEEMTGELTSPVVPQKAMIKLPCYSPLTLGTQYLRPCESQKYAQKRIEYELKLHGTDALYPEILCGEDGGFGPYSMIDGAAFCVWKDNTKLGVWHSGDTIGYMDCNCARDTRIYKDAGKTQNQKCTSDGNYSELQNLGKNGYCVDKDGFRKSGSENVDDPDDCAAFDAYH